MWFKSECDKISERLWDYSAQRLSTAETAQIESHLLQCARCQTEAEAYRQTVGMLGMARQMPVPASQTTWHDLRPSLAPVRRPVLRSADLLPRLTLAGAGAALGATLLVVFLSGGHPITPTGNTTARASGPQQSTSGTPSPSSEADEVAQSDTGSKGHDIAPPGSTFGSFFPTAPAVLQASNAKEQADSAPPPKTLAPHRRRAPRFTRVAVGETHSKAFTTSEDTDAQLDGGNVSPRTPQNYVLNPVSSSSDDETARHYVISSIPAAQNGNSAVASNEGADEGRAW